MKIAIVSRGHSTQKGGAERFTISLIKKLIEKGHEVHLFSAENTNIQINGLKFTPVKYFSFISSLKIFSFHFSVSKLLKKENFDVIYGLCQFYPLDFFYAGGGVHKHWMFLNSKNILFRLFKYIINPVHLLMVYIENHIFSTKSKNIIITNSKLVKNHIIQYYNLPDNRIKVIYDGVDSSVFKESVNKKNKELRIKLNYKEDDIVILFVANNWKRKGLMTIIKALDKLSNQFKLLVIGKGKPDKYIKNPLINNRLLFLGSVNDIQNYYAASDIFVLPTQYDPFAQVCKEAMVTGLPVITTFENGASEIIEQGKNGFILNSSFDVKGLVEYLNILKDASIRKSYGINAYEAAKKFTWEKNAEEHLELFSNFIKH